MPENDEKRRGRVVGYRVSPVYDIKPGEISRLASCVECGAHVPQGDGQDGVDDYYCREHEPLAHILRLKSDLVGKRVRDNEETRKRRRAVLERVDRLRERALALGVSYVSSVGGHDDADDELDEFERCLDDIERREAERKEAKTGRVGDAERNSRVARLREQARRLGVAYVHSMGASDRELEEMEYCLDDIERREAERKAGGTDALKAKLGRMTVVPDDPTGEVAKLKERMRKMGILTVDTVGGDGTGPVSVDTMNLCLDLIEQNESGMSDLGPAGERPIRQADIDALPVDPAFAADARNFLSQEQLDSMLGAIARGHGSSVPEEAPAAGKAYMKDANVGWDAPLLSMEDGKVVLRDVEGVVAAWLADGDIIHAYIVAEGAPASAPTYVVRLVKGKVVLEYAEHAYQALVKRGSCFDVYVFTGELVGDTHVYSLYSVATGNHVSNVSMEEALKAMYAADRRTKRLNRLVADACMTYRHDFGLLPYVQREKLRGMAERWLLPIARALGAEPVLDHGATPVFLDMPPRAYQRREHTGSPEGTVSIPSLWLTPREGDRGRAESAVAGVSDNGLGRDPNAITLQDVKDGMERMERDHPELLEHFRSGDFGRGYPWDGMAEQAARMNDGAAKREAESIRTDETPEAYVERVKREARARCDVAQREAFVQGYVWSCRQVDGTTKRKGDVAALRFAARLELAKRLRSGLALRPTMAENFAIGALVASEHAPLLSTALDDVAPREAKRLADLGQLGVPPKGKQQDCADLRAAYMQGYLWQVVDGHGDSIDFHVLHDAEMGATMFMATGTVELVATDAFVQGAMRAFRRKDDDAEPPANFAEYAGIAAGQLAERNELGIWESIGVPE